jgi:PEP-CTERM motif
MHKSLISLAVIGIASLGFATDLVTNGNFEALPQGTGWTTGGTALIQDSSGIDIDGFGTFGPPTVTAWLGDVDLADDSVTQSISTIASPTSAFLDFDWYLNNVDVAGFDFLTVSIGATTVFTVDLGDNNATALYGPFHQHINVASLMDGTAKNLVFRVTTDSAAASGAFIDNVSLNVTTVPEPASFAILGVGAIALVRRRKKA